MCHHAQCYGWAEERFTQNALEEKLSASVRLSHLLDALVDLVHLVLELLKLIFRLQECHFLVCCGLQS